MVKLSHWQEDKSTMLKFNLRQLLFDRDMNMSDLKRKIEEISKKEDYTYGTIFNYFHGYAKRLNVEDICLICEALGCQVGDLLEYIPDKKKEPI
jgi:putative transcriptional regulator